MPCNIVEGESWENKSTNSMSICINTQRIFELVGHRMQLFTFHLTGKNTRQETLVYWFILHVTNDKVGLAINLSFFTFRSISQLISWNVWQKVKNPIYTYCSWFKFLCFVNAAKNKPWNPLMFRENTNSIVKPAIHLSSNWREREKMFTKWEKW